LASELRLEKETMLLAACADGAGSAKLAAEGAQTACNAVIGAIARNIGTRSELGRIERPQAMQWFQIARDAIEAQAVISEAELRDFACTLMVAVVGEFGACFTQIGDGAIAQFDGCAYQPVFWPQSGEYANTTNFLTHPRFEEHAEFTWTDRVVDEVAMFTDGLQSVALHYSSRQVHQPFFSPLFASLRSASSSEELNAPLRNYLLSPQLDERTDDDRTLVLATRVLPITQTVEVQTAEGVAAPKADG
jgi:hypothetical protein